MPVGSSHERVDERTTVAIGRRRSRSSSVPGSLHGTERGARPRYGGAWAVSLETGIEREAAKIVLERALDEADALGRMDLALRARLELAYVTTLVGTEVDAAATEELALQAIGALEQHRDDEGLARAWFVLATTYWTRGLWDDMDAPLSRSIEYARRAGIRSQELEALAHRLAGLMFGSTPVAEGLAAAREIYESVPDSRELQGRAMRFIGTFLALEGRVDEGRELLEQARAIFTELADSEQLMTLAFSTGPLEQTAGDLDAAEREYRHAVELARRMGASGRLTNLAAGLADVLLDQGRLDRASDAVDLSRASAAGDDPSGQAAWRMVAARLSLSRGDIAEAVRLARESMAIAESIQELVTLPGLLIRQAEVFRLAGLDEEARGALGRAVDASRRKGASADTRRADQLLAVLGTA